VAVVTSTITSVRALLAAVAPRRSQAATRGLRGRPGDRGVVVIKDVTSILSMDRNARADVLTVLRRDL
jgi:hypothetical protein